jgi:rhodanese-related sulfurtransferase
MKLENKQIGIYTALLIAVTIVFLPSPHTMGLNGNHDVVVKEIINGEDQIDPALLQQWIIEDMEDFVLIDIRDKGEYSQGSIPGAVNISLGDLLKKETIDDLPEEEIIVLYSNGNTHVSQARVLLSSAGKSTVYLNSGYNGWQRYKADPGSGFIVDDEKLVKTAVNTKKETTTKIAGSSIKTIKFKKSKKKKGRKGDGC